MCALARCSRPSRTAAASKESIGSKDEKEKQIAQINEFAQKTGIDIRTDSFDSSLYAIGEAVKAIALAKKGSGVLCWKMQEATVAMTRLGEAMAALEPFLREIKDNPIIGP